MENRVQGSGIKLPTLEFWGWGFEFRVWVLGSGVGVSGFGFLVGGLEFEGWDGLELSDQGL